MLRLCICVCTLKSLKKLLLIALRRHWYKGASFYIISGTVEYLLIPSVERWYVLSSVVRRYISFIVSGTSMNYLLLYHQWYGGIYLFNTFSGTLVCVIVSGTAVHLFHRQWYVDESSLLYHQWYGGIYLFMPSLECW